MLYSMNHIAKLYSAGFVSIRICACISLVLPILWRFSHSTEFVPESCQLPFFFIFHCHCFVHNFSKYHSPCQKTGWKYSNFSWANNFLFHCRILDFLREAASVAAAQDAVLLFSNLFFTFVEKLTFFLCFLKSVLQLQYCIWVESIVSLCCPSNLILFLSTENNPVLFSGSICCFKKQKEKLFCTLEGNRNHISLNCYDLIRPKQPTGTRYCKCMHYGECKGD